ncbi:MULTISPECIES: gliding motility-associated C-terminal domain-containing protein [Chryseobacterium]|uniref:Gliding motility-associated C-terminal domain n=1 Tax=Chryseobacterium taihuense TaxID=1141221 RepID=A0A4U8WE68_9FLAO|nr:MULTISPECIES: gliding motility-associated C-terminal domain-containing protein [Chryseobacterium]QQV02050.1 gliding motility-associated C-terminal domain-containing protein [Chryseobacterium sp. FDAARGOS 1104]VFB04721.1 gliding motility-associated C-terminal domain [Chryseobacterium taihuense]
MKRVLLLICTFLCLLFNAQLDTEHWFAPMASKAGNNGLEGYLYLSTDETVPFTVQIFNNNTLYTSTQISKGNPAQIIIPNNFLITSNQFDLFTPNSMGLNVKGPKRFFANYRFSLQNHAEIITSKGLAGLGTTFFAGTVPITGSATYVNSTIGVTATEDNTTVVISGYNPNVVFSDGTSSPTRTFTLNKGQSYIVDARSTDSPFNPTGLVGAKIVSTKPISVTNGNFNGIYTNLNFSNNDVLMDQAVPVNRLGKDFIMVKGNGNVANEMETALIIATEDNTQIAFNGAGTAVTLNAGQYYMVPTGNYINQGSGNYNMNITSNKNIYVYQLLAGIMGGGSNNEFATGGMNFIPPLSCFMPNKVDEIGFINMIGGQAFNTKLNIITQTGAVVTLNGNPIAANNGPYPVTGNPNWVTYSVPNVSGIISVNSTKSVTAGIAAGSGAVGYGGYFAGFSSVPAISKTGDCYAGILLQVDNSYDSYQWFLNGNPIPGATSFSINPELYGAGNYTCQITKNNCESKLTAIYNYTLCPPITTTTYTIGSCNTKVITPSFSNSTQNIVPSLTGIILQPTSGTAAVNSANGHITYTPNSTLTSNTTDTFIYYIQGNGNPFDFEYFKIIINTDVLQTNNASLVSCANSAGNGTFDLTTANLTTNSGTSVVYYTNSNLTGQINSPNNYTGPAGTIYANVTSVYGCSKPAQITLTVNPLPNINTSSFNANLCDDNLDGIINVNFSTITPQIVTNSGSFTVRYYLNQTDANAGNNNTLPNNWTYTAATTVYVRVDGINTNCPAAFGQINFSIGSKIPLSTLDYSTLVCDTNWDGTETVNLNTYKNNFTTDPAVTLSFYSTFSNAQNAINAINANQIIATSQVFYIRFQTSGSCPNIAKITLSLDQLSTSNATLSACANANGTANFNLTTATVTANPGATVLFFSDALLTTPIATPTNYNSSGGIVYAQVSSGFGCTKTAQINLVINPLPNINTANYNAALCDDNFDGIISVNFSTVSPQIVTNSGNFNVRYYLNQTDANAGNNNTLPNNWTYTAPTTVYVRVDGIGTNCTPAFGQINFQIGNRITLLATNATTDVCDNDLNGTQAVNLNDYKNLFSTDPSVVLTFYNTLANAQAGTNAITPNQNITSVSTFYIRFTSSNACPNTAVLTVNLKSPKKSEILKNQIVCANQKALLDAGAGFTSYSWSTGATTQSISAGEGVYFVDLGFNGCVYRQTVTVTNAPLPVVTSVTVTGNTATINVTGGTPPYQYSLNGIDYQSSNVFTGLVRGPYKVYVIGRDGCQPVTKDFLLLNLINTITPNNDGKNDVLDYSDLKIKDQVSIEVVDRYGASVYRSSGKNYIWDGKSGGRHLSTGTYWYIIKWIEPDTKLPVSHSGWLLIKNRE